ncbi:MAG TPA: hypothetical protein VFB30_09880, partial [Spirochaetia bacterium]|nr:hypothetical protein [Spirochaetia bacterium]
MRISVFIMGVVSCQEKKAPRYLARYSAQFRGFWPPQAHFSRPTARAIVRGMSSKRYPRMEALSPTGQTRVVREIFT